LRDFHPIARKDGSNTAPIFFQGFCESIVILFPSDYLTTYSLS
jgi:hypothetical protein